MGLDMIALKRKHLRIVSDDDPYGEENWAEGENEEKFFYWRKHPNLHGWMENLYYEKGGDADVFNCVEVELTLDDIEDLESDIENDNLPQTTGFFFGESAPDRKEEDLEFIEKAKEAIKDGYTIVYTSWW